MTASYENIYANISSINFFLKVKKKINKWRCIHLFKRINIFKLQKTRIQELQVMEKGIEELFNFFDI